MGMRTRLDLIRKADDRYRELYAVFKVCHEAGVSPPAEVTEYFGDVDFTEIDPVGFPAWEIDKYTEDLPDGVSVSRPHSEALGWEIDLDQLDPLVRVIRFSNSW